MDPRLILSECIFRGTLMTEALSQRLVEVSAQRGNAASADIITPSGRQ